MLTEEEHSEEKEIPWARDDEMVAFEASFAERGDCRWMEGVSGGNAHFVEPKLDRLVVRVKERSHYILGTWKSKVFVKFTMVDR